MQNYQDTYTKNWAEQIIRAQDSGKLVAVEAGFEDRYPLPVITELPGVQAARNGGYEINIFPFRRVGIPGIWDISAARLPGVPAIPLKLASVHAHENGALVSISNRSQFSLDELWTAGENAYEFLGKVNQHLAGDKTLGAIAWELTWVDDFERPHAMRLSTEHVSAVCSSAAWDTENHQLVAATLVSPSTQSLRAITATLATNSKKGLTLSVDGSSHFLQNTRRGFTAVSGSLADSGAEGNVLSIVHPLTGNPQEQPADYFYVLAPKEQNLAEIFCERLALAIAWPTQPEWVSYLMEAGSEKELVRHLDTCGPDFGSALCVLKNEAGWKTIIESGLSEGRIGISTAR